MANLCFFSMFISFILSSSFISISIFPSSFRSSSNAISSSSSSPSFLVLLVFQVISVFLNFLNFVVLLLLFSLIFRLLIFLVLLGLTYLYMLKTNFLKHMINNQIVGYNVLRKFQVVAL